MSAKPTFSERGFSAVRQPFSLGMSALVAGMAVFLLDADFDLLGFAMIGTAILLLLHTGLSIGTMTDTPAYVLARTPADHPPAPRTAGHMRFAAKRESTYNA